MKRHIIASAALLAASMAMAAPACLPPTSNGMPVWAVSQNARGCWAGWWCSKDVQYIAAATKQQCNLVGVQRAVAAWLSAPTVEALAFGPDPATDPTLRAVWEPERAKLDTLRPQ